MSNKEFGLAIRQLRKEHNLTMQALANMLGVTKGAVNTWENNGVVPRDDVLIKLSQKFNISIDKLLGNNISTAESETNSKLSYIQRNLEKMDNRQLVRAEIMLKAAFIDIFNDDEGEEDDDL